MSRPIRTSCMLILVISVFLCVSFVTPVFAIVPQITNVVVWDSGGNTVLNVTVFHTPEQIDHYVDLIQVDVGGNIQNFTVEVQPTTTFIVQCNVGPIEGTPSATVRAHCTVDEYNAWSEPFQIPEFSLPVLLLTLTLIAFLVVFVFRKTKLKRH